MRGQKRQNKAPVGKMEQRDQQQKRDWGHRKVINKGHKNLSFSIQASFPSVMTAGVYHKTALGCCTRREKATGRNWKSNVCPGLCLFFWA